MKKKFISTAIALALGFSTQAFAETIRIDRSQIEQTSALTTADLITNLTFQQGGTTLSSSINGGARGEVTASIHGMGARYTTILINGRRLVGQNSNSSANLNAIPLSLIDYIEVSSSTLSSNVINIVTKKAQSGFEVGFAYATPQQDASGKTNNFNLSKGFGDIGKDGYNLTLNYAHDEQRSLNAADRDFAQHGGLTKFNDGGKAYAMYLPTSSNQPANVSLFGGGISSLNPYLLANGTCPDGNLQIGRRCFTDYAANVDLIPSRKNESVNASLKVRLNDATSLYVEGLQSKTAVTSAYSYAAQAMSIDRSDPLFQKFIIPAYTAAGGSQASRISGASINMRLNDAARRTDRFEENTKHLVSGVQSKVGAWDIDASYVYSESKLSDIAAGGYLSKNRLMDIINAGNWNPFALPSSAGAAALSPAVLHQEIEGQTKKLSMVNISGSRTVDASTLKFSIEAGKESLIDTPSAIAQGANPTQPNFTDAIIGGMYGAVPFDSSRTNWTVQGEFNTKPSKTLNLSAGGRFDSFSAVKNNRAFDDNLNPINAVTQGSTQRASSFHIDASYRASDRMTIQGSFATGFRVPDLKDIAAPTLNAGYSGLHSFIGCQIVGGTFFYQLKSLCQNDYTYPQEYQLISGGNTSAANGLRPEKISQYRVGFSLQPIDSLEIKATLWGALIKNQISMLTDDEVFADPMKYQSNFVAYLDPVLQSKVLAIRLTPSNRGSSSFKGIDFENTYRTDTSFGKIAFNWAGTYMLKSTNTVNQKSEDYVGRFNSLGDVTFKLISKLTGVWQPSSRYTHSLSLNYKSGYRDMPVSADQAIVKAVNAADGSLGDYAEVSRSVKPYHTVDWQSKIHYSENLTVTAGIKNLFNQEPPFSVRNVGGGMGLGFDGRYTDPLGRQFYVRSNLKF